VTLFFLHGVGGGHAAWERQVAHFSALGYRCVAWDQPGYGSSPLVDPYSLETVTQALRGQLAKGLRALGLCFTTATFGGGGQFARDFIAARIAPLDEGKTMAQVAAKLMPTMRGSRSEPQGLALAERVMASIAPGTYRKAVQLLTTFDRRADLAKIAVPALLVAGSEDRTAPPAAMERMAKSIPGAELVVLEGCGHLGPMDQPDAFNAVLEQFLRKNAI
jgi:pimeloyl-ACP methyl ester carboxylesterase